MTPVPDSESVLILDFGAQYAQLIARRVREQNVFCQLVRHDVSAQRVADLKPRGLILSGGPASVYSPGAPHCDPKLFDLGIPVLGICYGMQLACQALGGEVKPASSREFGRAHCHIREANGLFQGVPQETRLDEPRRPGAQPRATSFRLPRRTRARRRRSAIGSGRFMACSFIPKSATHPLAARSSATSCTTFAAARGAGRCSRSSTRR